MSIDSSPDYHPLKHLEALLDGPDALDHLDVLLDKTHHYKLQLDNEIAAEVGAYNSVEPTKQTIKFDDIVEAFSNTKTETYIMETSIAEMTSKIKKLDDAKKNLVITMTVVKRLQMLYDGYDSLVEHVKNHDYINSVALLNVVVELITHFMSYRNIDEIDKLSSNIDLLRGTIVKQIMSDFMAMKLSPSQLCAGCEMMDTLKEKDTLMSWFVKKQLQELNDIFSPQDEAGSLDNLNRRFIYFKRVLQQFEDLYKESFPVEWKVSQSIAGQFLIDTREAVKVVLKTTKWEVTTLLESLQQTLDLEQYLSVKFSFKFADKISTAFEPHLNVWVDHQSESLKSQLLEFMSQPKLVAESQVIPSIADLFRTYKSLLSQTASLSTGSALAELCTVFSRWLLEYLNKIVKPTIPTSVTVEGSVTYICLVLNTCDYASTTISQLEELVLDVIKEVYKSKVSFENIKSQYIAVTNHCIGMLLTKAAQDTTLAWREFDNSDWVITDEPSRYMNTLCDLLNDSCGAILPLFNRDLYVRNFLDKLLDQTCVVYTQRIYTLAPLKVVEQLMQDVEKLKECFIALPGLRQDYKIPSTYAKGVATRISKLETILKMCISDDFLSDYFKIVGDSNIQNYQMVCKLAGETPVPNFKELATGNLVPESGIFNGVKETPQRVSSQTMTAQPQHHRAMSPVDNLSTKFGKLFSKN